MNTATAPIRTFILGTFVLVVGASACWAAEPTLARMAFWVPPERMAEFEAAYAETVVPILKAHGLVVSSEPGRATPDSIFARLFKFKTPIDVEATRRSLIDDPAWQDVRYVLGATFGTSWQSGSIHWELRPYRSSAGPGIQVPAGPGTQVLAGSGGGHWRTYEASDGLGPGSVRAILQDREGYLWFATEGGGVSRYDGHKFTTFTTKDGLASNLLFSIFQDREGNIWFGTNRGVSRYDGSRWNTFTKKDGLLSNNVLSIFQDREGNIWFGTSRGVSRYDGLTNTFIAEDGLGADSGVWSIFQDRQGYLWFGTTRDGVSRYDGETFTTFTTENGLASDGVHTIFEDREGDIWFGYAVQAGGVSRYDGKTFTTFTTEDGLAENNVRSIFQDRAGYLWFGHRVSGGVSRYDGETFTTFTPEDGLAGNIVMSIIQDREGHLWFGTNDGVSQYGGEGLATFTFGEEDSLLNSVQSIFQNREGYLWFGTEDGVSRYDGVNFTTFTTEDGLVDDRVRSIMQDREGHLWFGTGGGVSRYNGQTFTNFTTADGLPHNSVQSIFQDREGHLWFGTNICLSRYDGRTFTNFTQADGLPHSTVRSIFQDREGDLWFGTNNGGVSRYNGKTFESFTIGDRMIFNRVWSIFQDQEGHFWFAFWGGAVRYDGRTLTIFTTEDGLVENRVRSIMQDREGHLWFGTEGGVSRYDGRVFQTLTRQDGLASKRTLTMLQDREGSFWFGTNRGITRYRHTTSPPPVFIDAVVADRHYKGVSEVAIPSSIGLTVFEFHGISFKTRPEAMVYRYRLREYDADWQVTHDRRVEYQDLPEGDYTFEVVAVDRDLVYSETPATVELNVHLPYERIGWMSALSIAIVLIGWQTVRVIRRDRRLQETNTALSDANRELFGVNKDLEQKTEDLERERSVERIRGEIQAMEQASDFEGVLSLLAEDLKAVGLRFDTCGIDLLDEPVDEPTMAYFEVHGFRYTAYTIDPGGTVSRKAYHLPAPFPPVTLETIERFLAGEPWQGRSGETAIVEVPASSYGRLRITAPDRERFAGEDIDALQDFAVAIALGYARYLDFQQIQEQTERKSRFLASMSHELRTPITAIKGFVDNMLDGITGELNERQQRNLKRVTENSGHLLHLVNDLLDLSKIEANRMDVEVETFDVVDLIASCCDGVGSLVKPGVTLKQDVADEVGEAHTDGGRLRQILTNLLSNALKFTDSGEVVVRVSKDGRADGEASLIIAVSDTGSGMPADALESIFEEFQQVKGSDPQHKGTGLGLPITKGFVELLGGTIGVQSEVGKGSTFTVRVPVVYKEG